jgi:hypothetical protein
MMAVSNPETSVNFTRLHGATSQKTSSRLERVSPVTINPYLFSVVYAGKVFTSSLMKDRNMVHEFAHLQFCSEGSAPADTKRKGSFRSQHEQLLESLLFAELFDFLLTGFISLSSSGEVVLL